MKKSSLIVPNDLAYLSVALSFVRENAALIGFEAAATHAIDLGAEEAISNVMKHAFAPSEDAEFSIICEHLPLGLKIVIKDKGQPFDPDAAPEYDSSNPEEALSGGGLGLFLMREFMDEVSFHILGRDGNELHLVKYLYGEAAERPSAPEDTADSGRTDEPVPLPPRSVPFVVRLAEPSEAIEITKCAYEAYEYSYGHEHIYYPERLKKLIESGAIVSAVAVTDDDSRTIMAHNALILDNPDDATAEIGMAFTKKRYQSQGCAQATGQFLFKEAIRRGLYGILIDCTTAHVYSQRAALSAGARECCILLGIDPEAQSWKHFTSQSQRVSNVIAHIRVPSTTWPTPRRVWSIYAPPQHREMIEKIYANLGEAPSFPEEHPPAELPESLSSIEVHTGASYQKTASIEAKRYGADIVPQIGRALKRLCLDRLEVVYLFLDLSDALTATVTGKLEALGFFFAGIIPRADGADRLELQYLNNVLIDYDRIHLYSDFAKELLGYIQAHDPTSNEAYLR